MKRKTEERLALYSDWFVAEFLPLASYALFLWVCSRILFHFHIYL